MSAHWLWARVHLSKLYVMQTFALSTYGLLSLDSNLVLLLPVPFSLILQESLPEFLPFCLPFDLTFSTVLL